MLFCGYITDMDTLPDLLSETVGDATVIDTVDIGGGDAVVVTNRATHVYRADGLLSDESVETFGHDVGRLSMQTKRRKSEIRLETIDGDRSFTVPSKVVDPIVEAMIKGILRTTGVVEDDEAILAQFRFSELTLVVSDSRLFEQVGSAVWDEDFEAVEYAELTGLAFEKGSVATQVVIETEARRRRVKVPNEHAGRVRRAIQDAVFDFHGVSSLEELRAKLSAETAESEADARTDSEHAVENRSEPASGDPESDGEGDSFVSADWTPAADQDVTESSAWNADRRAGDAGASETKTAGSETNGQTKRSGDPDVETLAERVDGLSEQVERQTELIESQKELIEQLVEELRRGR
jgi:hypothetical protein